MNEIDFSLFILVAGLLFLQPRVLQEELGPPQEPSQAGQVRRGQPVQQEGGGSL